MYALRIYRNKDCNTGSFHSLETNRFSKAIILYWYIRSIGTYVA